jgi:hypothetical protein
LFEQLVDCTEEGAIHREEVSVTALLFSSLVLIQVRIDCSLLTALYSLISTHFFLTGV